MLSGSGGSCGAGAGGAKQDPAVEDRRGYDRSVGTQNRRGEWVPSIPLPLFVGILDTRLMRHRCSCGQTFWTMRGYEGHYALEHILGLGSDA